MPEQLAAADEVPLPPVLAGADPPLEFPLAVEEPPVELPPTAELPPEELLGPSSASLLQAVAQVSSKAPRHVENVSR